MVSFLTGVRSNKQSVELVKLSNARLNSSGLVHTDIELSSDLEMEFVQISYIVISNDFPFQYGFTYNESPYSLTIVTEIENNQMVVFKWAIEATQEALQC